MFKLKVNAKVFISLLQLGDRWEGLWGIIIKVYSLKKYVCLYRYVEVYMCICMHVCMDIYIYHKNIWGIGNDADIYIDGTNILSSILS